MAFFDKILKQNQPQNPLRDEAPEVEIEEEIEVEPERPEPLGLDAQIGSADQIKLGTQPQPRGSDYLSRMGLAPEPEEAPTNAPPTDIENRWAEEELAEELKEIEAEIKETDKLLSETPEPDAEESGKKKKGRKSLGRKNQIKTRLTDAEMTKFQRRVKKSGLSQGEFLRSVAITGKIVIEERNLVDVALLDELALLRAEIGRQGGLLKMIIKPNQGQRELAPREWDELIAAVRDLENMKEKIMRMEEKVNGNSEA